MEYLDPVKQRRYRIRLWLVYGLVTIIISIGVVVLLWEAYGFGYKHGKLIQNGMVYVSSQPNPANINLNNTANYATTNSRLTIPAGNYHISISAPGYKPWKHQITVIGDTVMHYDYPLLVPTNLKQTSIANYNQQPAFASQSPNQQYLLIPDAAANGSFELYDLTSPKTAPVTLNLPSGVYTAATSTQSWQVVGWANDNQHVLLQHNYDGSREFILLDTQNPSQSLNLNKTFTITPSEVTLNNLNYDHYYLFNQATGQLYRASLSQTKPVLVEKDVVAFRSYQSNDLIYATTDGAPSGQVAVHLAVNGSDSFVRNLPTASTYLLDIASYNSDDYTIVGSSSSPTYIYLDALEAVGNNQPFVPLLALNLAGANYEAFAPTAQFILVENGSQFMVYDALNNALYSYNTNQPLDSPQLHAQWMDGDRLVYISSGKLVMRDFDNTNQHSLNAALPAYQTFFAPDYHSYFNLASKGKLIQLLQTSLVAS